MSENEPTRMDKMLQRIRMPLYALYRTAATVAFGMALPQLEGIYFYSFIVVGVLHFADKALDVWARERRPPPRMQVGASVLLQGADAERLQEMLESLTGGKQEQSRSGLQ